MRELLHQRGSTNGHVRYLGPENDEDQLSLSLQCAKIEHEARLRR